MPFFEDIVLGELEPPTDEAMARILFIMADQQGVGLRTLLWLIKESRIASAQVERLWKLVVDAGMEREGASGILAAMEIADQLDELKKSVERQWTNPADVLDPDGDKGVDVHALLSLAQEQFAASETTDGALGTVVVRILTHLEVIKERTLNGRTHPSTLRSKGEEKRSSTE